MTERSECGFESWPWPWYLCPWARHFTVHFFSSPRRITYPPCWVLKARIQKHRGKPLLSHDKCPGFFYVHYTTHGTYTFTSHPKDEAIMVKCLAQGHKRRDRPGRDSNPHSDNIRTWVQCTRPLGHDTPMGIEQGKGWYFVWPSGLVHQTFVLMAESSECGFESWPRPGS